MTTSTSRERRRAVVLLGLLSGCFPFLIPPASIGPFIEPGFRWMNEIGNHGYISIGVILRMPMGAGVDVSGQH